MTSSLTSQHKAIISGLVVEHYYYKDTSIPYGYKRNVERRKKLSTAELYETDDQKIEKKRQVALQNRIRTKTSAHRLIESNVFQYPDINNRPYTPKFVTLTFAKHITDTKRANRIYSQFMQRLNYLIYKTKCSRLSYLVVIEFTKQGRIHYHTLFFNLPVVAKPLLEQTWGQGYVNIKAVTKVPNLAHYMTKYMTKGFDDVRLEGKKRYFTSKNLLKPIVVREEDVVEQIVGALPFSKSTHNALIESPYIGSIEYTQYRMKPTLQGVYKINLPFLSPPRSLFELNSDDF